MQRRLVEEARAGGEDAKYMRKLQGIANRELRTLDVELDDLVSFAARKTTDDAQLDNLLAEVLRNTKRYVQLFAEAADELMPAPIAGRMQGPEDVIDVLTRQVRDGRRYTTTHTRMHTKIYFK